MIDDSYTKLLLHMDGADASTTFTDEAGINITAVGNAQIDTAQSKFGGASGLFDGTGDYIYGTLPSAIGTQDFTLDYWVRHTSFVNYEVHFSFRTAGASWSSSSNAAAGFTLHDMAAGVIFSPSGVFTLNTWHHVALVRSGTTIKGYVDGTEVGSGTYGYNITQTIFGIASHQPTDAAEYLFGSIDELRLSVGIARWTSNFTPPTSAYGPSSSKQSSLLLMGA